MWKAASVITGYRAEVDPRRLGLPILVIVRLNVVGDVLPRVTALVRAFPEVLGCYPRHRRRLVPPEGRRRDGRAPRGAHRPAHAVRHDLDIHCGTGGVRRAVEAWREDRDVRLHGGEPSSPASYDVRPVEIRPGDTTYDERMVEYARGAGILVHEVFGEAGFWNRTPEWRADHARYHTSGPDLGCLAAKVRPRTLVLTHQLLMGATREALLAEIRREWGGEIVDGQDLDVIR